jgi:hypothetical protein
LSCAAMSSSFEAGTFSAEAAAARSSERTRFRFIMEKLAYPINDRRRSFVTRRLFVTLLSRA